MLRNHSFITFAKLSENVCVSGGKKFSESFANGINEWSLILFTYSSLSLKKLETCIKPKPVDHLPSKIFIIIVFIIIIIIIFIIIIIIIIIIMYFI